MISKPINDGYTIREVTASEMKSYLNEHFDSVYRNRLTSLSQYSVDEMLQ